jgi:hypothetical protein
MNVTGHLEPQVARVSLPVLSNGQTVFDFAGRGKIDVVADVVVDHRLFVAAFRSDGVPGVSSTAPA